MDQPLLITRRPAADCYIVQAGGNTRLRILQELYESTGDERFRWVDCRYVEWDRESSVLLAHLRENELRGDLTFIDKAQAILDIKTLVAEEFGVGDISHRQLETVLKDHGYSVSHALISIMSYAAIVLAPLMPAALHGGLGKPQVQRVRRLDRVARDIWTRRHVGAEAEFNDVFAALCRRYDAVDWQIGGAVLRGRVSDSPERGFTVRVTFETAGLEASPAQLHHRRVDSHTAGVELRTAGVDFHTPLTDSGAAPIRAGRPNEYATKPQTFQDWHGHKAGSGRSVPNLESGAHREAVSASVARLAIPARIRSAARLPAQSDHRLGAGPQLSDRA
jgi:ParB family protein of integrating conjugative element (PFGI_1 class)